MMSAAPRSLDATRISTWNAASAVVITIFLNSSESLKLEATKNTKTIFTSSDGWIFATFVENPSFAPPDTPPQTTTAASETDTDHCVKFSPFCQKLEFPDDHWYNQTACNTCRRDHKLLDRIRIIQPRQHDKSNA